MCICMCWRVEDVEWYTLYQLGLAAIVVDSCTYKQTYARKCVLHTFFNLYLNTGGIQSKLDFFFMKKLFRI